MITCESGKMPEPDVAAISKQNYPRQPNRTFAHLDEVRAACARHSELQSELRENHRRQEALLSSFKLMIKELSL